MTTLKFIACVPVILLTVQLSAQSNGSKLDSSSSALKQEIQGVTDVIKVSNPLQTVKSEGKQLFNTITSKVDLFSHGKPVSFGDFNFSTGYYYNRDTAGLTSGIYRDMQGVFDYTLTGELSVMQIPFSLSTDANKGFYGFNNTSFNDFYAFKFDAGKYRDLLKDQVLKKINPEVILSSILNRIKSIQQSYEQSLQRELLDISQEYTKNFGEKLDLPTDVIDLSKTDLAGFKNKLFNETSAQLVNENRLRYQELTSHGPLTEESKKSAHEMLAVIGKYEALEKTYSKVTGWKDKFENNKTVKDLRSHLPFTPQQFNSYLQKPGNLSDVIRKYANLLSFQSFFMNMTKLDIGQTPLSNGQFSLQGLMNNGVNTAFQGKKAGGGIIVGSHANVNNWMRAGLESFTTNEYSGLTGFTLGSGSSSRVDQSISVNLFNFMNTPGMTGSPELMQSRYLATAQHRDAVITYHSGFKFGTHNEIKVDLSKSLGSYNNQMKTDSTQYQGKAFGDVFGNGGSSNYAAAIDYQTEIANTDIQLAFRKVGLGYSNPGNMFLRRGETGATVGLGRKLFHQKLTIKYKGDYRQQNFDPLKKYTYTTFSNKLQLRLKLKKNNRIGLSYQRSDYKSELYAQPTRKGASYFLQADGSYRVNLFDKPLINTVTLSNQSMYLPLDAGYAFHNKSLFLMHTSSLVIQRSIMTLSFMANHASSDSFYFSTSFINGETSFSYSLSDKFRMSSGIGYYSNTGWNNQVGIKQQLSATIMKKMDIDIGVDYKKALKTIRKELANQLFINATARYGF